MTEKCINCGAEISLHQYETNKCPLGGIEAPVGKRQQWVNTVFELPDNRDEIIKQLKQENKQLKELLKDLYRCIDDPTSIEHTKDVMFQVRELLKSK